MKSPDISILLPHLRVKENDKALQVAMDCLIDNTGLDYELVIEAVQERRDIYRVLNRMVEKAASDWIVFTNSDVFFAPGWAESMWEARQENRIVTGVIVECGAIGVNVMNYHRNFGMTPETFKRNQFEQWVSEGGEWRDGEGWYFPSLHYRPDFQRMGGFDLTRGVFPLDPLDIDYWERFKAAGGHVQRVASYCYHLQFYSSEAEQQKAARQS